MKMKWTFALIITSLFICGVSATASDTTVNSVNLYLTPGDSTGVDNSISQLVEELPDRLQNARLSVVVRPDNSENTDLVATVEHALLQRFPAIKLLDRKNLDEILAEQGRQLEQYAKATTVPDLQRVELAQAILFMDIDLNQPFWEISSATVSAAVVDVETAVKVWQSAPRKLINIWLGYLLIVVIILILFALPFFIVNRRKQHKTRIDVLDTYPLEKLCPRLQAVQERLNTLQRELHKRTFKDEAREIHHLNESLNHLIDRAEILDTSMDRSVGASRSKTVFDSLNKTADRIDKIEKTATALMAKIRQNNVKSFDNALNEMKELADTLLSNFTHLEELK